MLKMSVCVSTGFAETSVKRHAFAVVFKCTKCKRSVLFRFFLFRQVNRAFLQTHSSTSDTSEELEQDVNLLHIDDDVPKKRSRMDGAEDGQAKVEYFIIVNRILNVCTSGAFPGS